MGLSITVGLLASLCGEGKGDLFATWFSNHNFLLINGVCSISKLGNVEALVLNLILALDFCDLDSLGDADLLRSRIGQRAGLFKRSSNKRNFVGLGLVLLTAVLMFSMTIAGRSISRWSTGCHLHCLRLLLISDLCSGAGCCHIFPLVLISTDFSVNCGGGFLTDSEDAVKAVVIINNFFDCKSDRGHFLSKCWHTDLSIDRCVGVPAVELWLVPVARLSSSGGGNCHCEDKKALKYLGSIIRICT